MADPLRFTESKPDTRRRWVKVVLIVVALLALLFVILNLAGGGFGQHGPCRHQPGGCNGSTQPTSVTPPGGGHTGPPPGIDHGPGQP